jgi:Ca-activated chloride channel homolog
MARLFIATILVLLAPLAADSALATAGAPEMRVQGSLERLPLVMTRVDADISGVITDVTLTQIYENRGDETIEAVYRFPVTRNAAVYALSLRVGDRVVRAELQTREAAQQRYETAREAGQTTTLLEQRSTDALQLSIANILPGDHIEVQLSYSELLVPEGGRYRFFFPNTFGGPAYGGEAEEPVEVRLTTDDEAIVYALDVNLRITAPLPLQEITSPSHQVLIDQHASHQAIIQLSDLDARAAARDFIVDFRLAGDQIESGLLVHQEDDQGWFLLLAEPPAQVRRSDIVPREYLFVLDVSGSMSGFPIETTKALMRELVGQLYPHERFNLLLFDSRVAPLTLGQSLPPDPANLERALKAIDSQFGYGETRLVNALQEAYALPRTAGYSRTLIIITDAQIQAGPAVASLIHANLHQANAFALGIGRGVNHQVIEQIARAGRGEAILVTEPDEAAEKAAKLRALVDRPLLTDIEMAFEGIDAFDIEPEQIPDVFAERPIVVTGRYHGQAAGQARLTGRNADGVYQTELAFGAARFDDQQPAIKRLWARERLTSWIDGRLDGQQPGEVEGRVEQITAHALTYGLLSPWTAFVAVDEEIRSDGQVERVHQPAIQRELRFRGGTGFAPPPRQLIATTSPLAPPGRHRQLPSPGDKADQDGRLVVLLGETDEFLLAAEQYWKLRRTPAQVVSGIGSLAALRELLINHPGRGQEPWQEVILVSHASQWGGLALPLFAGQEPANLGILAEARTSLALAPLPPEVLNGQSRVRLEGCGIGRRSDIVEALADLLFAEQPSEFSVATDLVGYFHNQLASVRLELPYATRIIQDPETRDEVLRELRQQLLNSSSPVPITAWTDAVYPIEIRVPVADHPLSSRLNPRRAAARNSVIRKRLQAFGLAMDELHWRFETDPDNGQSKLVGQALVLVVRPDLKLVSSFAPEAQALAH